MRGGEDGGERVRRGGDDGGERCRGGDDGGERRDDGGEIEERRRIYSLEANRGYSIVKVLLKLVANVQRYNY